jgi:penicillin-binding protein 1A
LYGGLTIYSCENPELRQKAEAVYADDANFPAKLENDEIQPQAAIYVMDYTGKCVAVVGGRGEKTANRVLNRAVSSVRQPGSVMKPIGVYAPAVQLNLINFSSQIADAPITLPDGKLWPSNYNQTKPTDSGMTLVDYAVQSSKNTVAAQIMEILTPQRAFNFLTNSLRLSSLVVDDGKGNTDIDRAPMALGGLTNGLYVKEAAAAYQVFGNGGVYNKPYCFTKVMRGDEVLLETRPNPIQVLDADSAYVMNRLLQNVVKGTNGATAGALKTQFPEWEIFAKTGTTQQNNDVWLVAGTPKYVAASWFGYDMNQQLTSKQTSAARNLWIKVMQALHEGDEPMNFDALKGTTEEHLYCAETGLLATEECEKTKVGVYKPGYLPEECTCGKPVEDLPVLPPEEGGPTTTTTVTVTTVITTTTAA